MNEEGIRVYYLTMRLSSGSLVRESVDREPNCSTELFNALCAAIARKFDATVVDIKEV